MTIPPALAEGIAIYSCDTRSKFTYLRYRTLFADSPPIHQTHALSTPVHTTIMLHAALCSISISIPAT